MSLQHLRSLLQQGSQGGHRPLKSSTLIDKVLADVEQRSRANTSTYLPEDRQLEVLRNFWDSREISTFREVYFLSWGLNLPIRLGGPCVLEDKFRLQTVLDNIDRWAWKPIMYRRCYQGLARSYFSYDVHDELKSSEAGRANWPVLRNYLYQHVQRIGDARVHPEWVEATLSHRELFTADPYAAFEHHLVRGDSSRVQELCHRIGIPDASWFQRELILARVRAATRLDDAEFVAQLTELIGLFLRNNILRDRCLKLVLDRYVKVPGHPPHLGLRDAAVTSWGNPWLPSNATRWDGVAPEARDMVSDWLKLEFIETFFTKLAKDGLADPRRMNFWKRYVKAITSIEFALGATARNSDDRDMAVLRDKMKGLTRYLEAAGRNNAFIMRMGTLVAVEFSAENNAFYGYDANKRLPFDTAKLLRLEVDGYNSLKSYVATLKLNHQDSILGWEKWEDRFAAELSQQFQIHPLKEPLSGSTHHVARPAAQPAAPASPTLRASEPSRSSTPPSSNRPTTTPEAPASSTRHITQEQYSRQTLEWFAATYGMTIEDNTPKGGSLWVKPDVTLAVVVQTLTRWNFLCKPGKGWYRDENKRR